jgi:hypothetical protein
MMLNQGRLIVVWIVLAIMFSSCTTTHVPSEFPATGLHVPSMFPATKWMKIDTPTKLRIMKGFIEIAQKDGVTMRLSPEFYVKEVDGIIDNSIRYHDEKHLDTAVGIIIHTIAAMDGDWDNGRVKLEVATKWLGPENFESFKKRMPQKYARLLQPRKDVIDPWKYLGIGGTRHIYYDAESLSYVSETMVRVWVKMFYVDPQEGLEEMRVSGASVVKQQNYGHDLYLYKMDCSDNSFAILVNYEYQRDGALLETHDFPDIWTAVPPNSVAAAIFKVVCAQSGQIWNHDMIIPEEGKTKTE